MPTPLRFALLLVALCACGHPSRGTKRSGDPCEEDTDCAHGLCVEGVAGRSGHCTVSCGSQADCPRGWSCTGVTQRNIVVCTKAAPTPFGGGD